MDITSANIIVVQKKVECKKKIYYKKERAGMLLRTYIRKSLPALSKILTVTQIADAILQYQ